MFQLSVLKNTSSWWPGRSSLNWECSYFSGHLLEYLVIVGRMGPRTPPHPRPCTHGLWPVPLSFTPQLCLILRGAWCGQPACISKFQSHLLYVPPPNSVYPVEDEPGEEDCRLEKQVWDLLGKEFLGPVCLWYVLRRWSVVGTSTWPYRLSTLWGGVRPDKSQRGALL